MTVTERLPHLPVPGPGRGRPDRIRWAPAGTRGALARRVPGSAPLRWLQFLVLTIVVLQRFVVPGTAVFLLLPITFVVVTVLLLLGHVVADVPRTLLYLGAMAACCAAGLLVSTVSGLELSLLSLALLGLIYLPCCTRVEPGLRQHFPRLLEFFQRLMTVAAAVCVAQWAAQALGIWQYQDLLEFLPPQFLVSPGDFNRSYPIYYGSPIFKSNGVVFLEPSFASQFLALAIIVQLLLGRGRWRLVLLVAGLLATFSGTGLLLLACGLSVLAIRRGGRWAVRATMVVVVTVAAVATTPAGELLLDRSGETSQQGSSGNMRFVAPYQQVFTALPADVTALFIGRGPGSVTRDIEFFNPLGVQANFPALPKMLGEYGLFASAVLLAFLLTIFVRRVPSPTLGIATCLLFFVLSGALLQPPVVYLAWLLTGLFAAPPRDARAGFRRRTHRAAPTVAGSSMKLCRTYP